MSMFCYQCEQTLQGKGCDKIGVCSKDETTSNLQDLLVYSLRGLSLVAEAGRAVKVVDAEADEGEEDGEEEPPRGGGQGSSCSPTA